MTNKLHFFCAALVVSGMMVGSVAADDLLRQGFTVPPHDAQIRCFWWWLNGNVTREAISRDLMELKAKGFGGVLIFDADGSGAANNSQVPAGPLFAGPKWRELFRHTLNEANRLGLEVSLNLQSGWDLGGPPVTPEQAAKMLTFSETRLSGPGAVEKTLLLPKTTLDYYRDVAVVAYPAPKTEHAPINRLRMKSAQTEGGRSAPDCSGLLADDPATEGEQACMAGDVIDLTDKMDERGTLRWDAPPGNWIVLRFGYTPTGARVTVGSGQWQGLVLDYLSADALRGYWDSVVEPLVTDAGQLAGTTWKYVHTDSWECRGMNWTADFFDQFRRRRGYDMLKYMPVLAGRIVDDRPTANRFLADFRKTVGDCIVENHYRVLAQLARRHGMGTHPESGGPHAGPFDSLRCLGTNDVPMSEFWAKSWEHRVKDGDRFFVKQPASVAHTYGRRLVAAEAFTTQGPNWEATLWDNLKPSFDRAACEGLNRVVWHTFTCSPDEMGKPGQEYCAGTHFNPNVTWWPMADAFTAYLNRCQFMLQQGLFVADAVYYYGDHVPNFTQLKAADPARVLPGYDYDVATEEVVLDRMDVKDGRIVLPDGMSYRLLVLPPLPAISLPVLEKIERMVEAGAVVLGPKPARASGLGNQPQNDREVGRIADRLWGADGAGRRIGKGCAVVGRSAREILRADGIPPDFDYHVPHSSVNKQTGVQNVSLDYIHRRDGETDIYFIRNCTDAPVAVDASFRVAERRPELWNPIDGSIRDLPEYRTTGRQTVVPLRFEPFGSYFVIFRKATDDSSRSISLESGATAGLSSSAVKQPSKNTAGQAGSGAQPTNFQDYEPVLSIDGSWQVSFDPRWGGPENATFDELVDWTARPEEGIKHYSGTAVYHKTFVPPPELAERKNLCLDLGAVRELARVRLNGRDLGVVWCPPWRVDISAAVRPGENLLEIEVVNFWPNRLIGDAKLPPEKRLTKTNIRAFQADAPLMPSGLLGPVRIVEAKRRSASGQTH